MYFYCDDLRQLRGSIKTLGRLVHRSVGIQKLLMPVSVSCPGGQDNGFYDKYGGKIHYFGKNIISNEKLSNKYL